jgi:hypothetical protein
VLRNVTSERGPLRTKAVRSADADSGLLAPGDDVTTSSPAATSQASSADRHETRFAGLPFIRRDALTRES